jgi:hypothetical protein
MEIEEEPTRSCAVRLWRDVFVLESTRHHQHTLLRFQLQLQLLQATGTVHRLSYCSQQNIFTTMAPQGDYTDLHELAKGWKAAVVRVTDPATRYVETSKHCNARPCGVFACWVIECVSHLLFFTFTGTSLRLRMIVEISLSTRQPLFALPLK